LKEFFHAILTAEIVILPGNPASQSRPLGDVGLAAGILYELFWIGLPLCTFSPRSHVFDETVERIVKDENQDDIYEKTGHKKLTVQNRRKNMNGS
jgi:hypothetical protein